VVFFGDSVPKDRVRRGMAAVNAAHSLLIVGSSLMVFSGFRFAEYARQQGKRVDAINFGKTRADCFLETKIEEDCGAALQRLAQHAMSNARPQQSALHQTWAAPQSAVGLFLE